MWDVHNPRNIVRVKDYRQLPASDIREAHAFGINKDFDGRTLVYLQSNHGIQIWDWSDVANNISLVADMQLPNTNTCRTTSACGGSTWRFPTSTSPTRMPECTW